MANTSYLQLYLDTDYILPIAVGADGNVVKYQNQQGENQLWLYFSKISSRDVYETGASMKANFEANQNGFYGDFWNNLEKGGNVGNDPFPYIELLEIAGLLEALRKWCKPILGTVTPTVVLNFASTIGIVARRQFIDYLAKKGFSVRSYSIEMNNLVAEKVLYDHRLTKHFTFGDQLLILQSTGSDILLSTMTWCGDRFLQGEKSTSLPKQGDDFKKRALAEMVVERMEQFNNMLSPSEISSEISFQTQFADKWLKCREGDSIRIKDFYYSSDPEQIYPSIQIDANQLDQLVKANSRDTTDKIKEYHDDNIVNNHQYTIFFGDVFKDEQFLTECIEITSSKNKFTYFNENALQEAMGRYYYAYGDMKEPVEELERRYLTMEQERERIRKYVKNAETLGSLRMAIDKSEQTVSKAIDNLKSHTSSIEDTWTVLMKDSKFDEAEKKLKEMSTDDVLTAALSELVDTLATIEDNTSLLTDLKQLNEIHVQEIVHNIEQGFERLQQLQAAAKGLENRPNELRERTQHYRDVYGTYLEFKHRLDKEQSIGGKRRVLEEMKDLDLTMEPQPEVNIKTVKAEFRCQLEAMGGGLFKKKKYTLKVSFDVTDGDALPFPCVVMIDNSEKGVLDRNAWCADLKAGVNHWEKTISTEELPQGSKYVVQLFPDEENAFKCNAIRCKSKQLKIT